MQQRDIKIHRMKENRNWSHYEETKEVIGTDYINRIYNCSYTSRYYYADMVCDRTLGMA